jgi:hypothetical protein
MDVSMISQKELYHIILVILLLKNVLKSPLKSKPTTSVCNTQMDIATKKLNVGLIEMLPLMKNLLKELIVCMVFLMKNVVQ